MKTIKRDGLTIRVYRYGFRPGYYAEAKNESGQRVAFTGVFSGKGSQERAIEAAISQARTGQAQGDRGLQGL